MIDYATPFLLALCGIGLAVIGAFLYEIGRSDEREHAKQEYEAKNAKLGEQMERLVTLLRNDCDIEVSWDGLRRFWSIELTEDGCLMRDRACKTEAENAELRELASKCMDALRGNGISLDEYEELEGMAYSLRVDF